MTAGDRCRKFGAEGLPEVLALVEAGQPTRPVRFLRVGAGVVIVGANEVTSFVAGAQLPPLWVSYFTF